MEKKVIWHEGLFLLPQHFQQQESYFSALAWRYANAGIRFRYGFTEIILDEDALAIGKVVIKKASGIFKDGSCFALPDGGRTLPPLEIDSRTGLVCLCMPASSPGTMDISFSTEPEAQARHYCLEQDLSNGISAIGESSQIQVAAPNLSLRFSEDCSGQFMSLNVARIVEKRADNRVILDGEFIPPAIDCGASNVLLKLIRDIHQLVENRAGNLAGRLAQPAQRGVGELVDFLVLQLLNRYTPLLQHYEQCPPRPEKLYEEMLQLSGELATYFSEKRQTTISAAYQHENLQSCLMPLYKDIRTFLSDILEQTSVEIPLEDRGYGIRLGRILDINLLRGAYFVIAVSADVPLDMLIARFPASVKIGAVEKISDLVRHQLPGIGLKQLGVAPRQLPFLAGYTYFELERRGDQWDLMEKSRAIAMHIGNEFPGLKIKLWAIKQ